jgi:hypothetical protein
MSRRSARFLRRTIVNRKRAPPRTRGAATPVDLQNVASSPGWSGSLAAIRSISASLKLANLALSVLDGAGA